MVQYHILKFLANHILKRIACSELLYAVQSWMIACTQLEIYWCNPQYVSRMLPQNERCLLQALSMHVEVFPDQEIKYVVACP